MKFSRNSSRLDPVLALVAGVQLVAVFALTGCTKKDASERPFPDGGPDHRSINGPVSNLNRRLLGHMLAESCDQAKAAIRTEVTAALDLRATEIEALGRSLPAPEGYRHVPTGPIETMEALAPATPRPGWNVEERSWAEVETAYREIKTRPVGADWVALNSYVRGLLVDDEDRIVYGKNLYLDKDSGPWIERALEQMSACIQDAACVGVRFDADVTAFLRANPYYRAALERIEGAAGDPAAQTAQVSALQRRLRADFRAKFQFRPYSAATSQQDSVCLLYTSPSPRD